nr:hypothetical protein [Limnohabitans sp. 2KL-51]
MVVDHNVAGVDSTKVCARTDQGIDSARWTAHAQIFEANRIDAQLHGLVGFVTDLQGFVLERAIQQFLTVEFGGGGNAFNFSLELNNFVIQSDSVGIVVGAVDRLHGQFTHALQDVGDFVHGAFTRLHQRDAVVGVANGHVQAASLGFHSGGNGQACCVVFGAVDALARGQLLHRSRNVAVVFGHRILCDQRLDVGVDNAHDFLSLNSWLRGQNSVRS